MDRIACTVGQLPNATVVHVRGEVDLVTAPTLHRVLVDVLNGAYCHLIVDLSGVEFLDVTGLGVIAGAHGRVTAADKRFTAVVTSTVVRRVLQATGLLRVWRVTGSIEDALNDV